MIFFALWKICQGVRWKQIEHLRNFPIGKLVAWSEKLGPVFSTISRELFEKTAKNITKITKFWKILEFLEINQDWTRKLPEALETNFKWFLSHGKRSEAISKIHEISPKMDSTGRQMDEILRFFFIFYLLTLCFSGFSLVSICFQELLDCWNSKFPHSG